MAGGRAQTRRAAAEIASAYANETDANDQSMSVDVDATRETDAGWFFPWHHEDLPAAGSSVFTVDKETGAVFVLGSAFPAERDIKYFDLGYRSKLYDLVVLTVADMERACDHLRKVRPSSIIPEYESGVVWRIARPLTRAEIGERLSSLPAVFPDINLYSRLEVLSLVEEDGSFEFEALPRLS